MKASFRIFYMPHDIIDLYLRVFDYFICPEVQDHQLLNIFLNGDGC